MAVTRKAAKIEQPAVTQHIQHLQEEMGVQLFRHEGKQLLVTEKGRYLRGATLAAGTAM